MSKVLTIKLTKSGSKNRTFIISDQFGNIIATNVSKNTLITGISYNVNDNVTMVTIESLGDCSFKKTLDIGTITPSDLINTKFTELKSSCLWRHLTNISNVYNNYYGKIEPYIIEYPFSYQYNDEILQNVKSYDKVYRYTQDGTGVFSYNDKVEFNNIWFTHAVVYNGQQSSGILELVPKPKNNLKEYLKYPIFKSDSKVITFTKSDNFYQYNSFWSIVSNKSIPLFVTSCESLSIDKEVNQVNMDYGTRSFKKETIRAKELKIRHILRRSDVSIVSQFIYSPSQLSYK